MRCLSQYRLSAADARALRVTDIYSLHRIVYDMFDDVRAGARDCASGILFADKGMRQGMRTLIVLADRLPRTPERGDLQTRELPEAYLQADNYSFEIVINPVRRENASRKLVPLRGREAVAQWFVAKAPAWGFAVHGPSLQVDALTVERFDKKGAGTATIATATLTGTLHVTEREAFVHSVCYGIGRAKAFGCGLLQIVPFST